jgi:hypothetical protein
MVAFLCIQCRLARCNCIYWARISACSTIGAFGCINNELVVALADCFDRAGGFAGTARDAFAGNYIGHDSTPCLLIVFVSRKSKQYTSKNLDYINNLGP